MNGVKYSEKKRHDERKTIRRIIMNERLYRNNFYFFELGFIFVLIPILIGSLISAPFLYFYAVLQEYRMWPIIVLVALIIFAQIIAFQYFIRRFYLEPNNMSLGQFLRHRYDFNKVKKKEKKEENEPTLTWYSDLDNFILKIRSEMKEQTEKIYSSVLDYYQIE